VADHGRGRRRQPIRPAAQARSQLAAALPQACPEASRWRLRGSAPDQAWELVPRPGTVRVLAAGCDHFATGLECTGPAPRGSARDLIRWPPRHSPSFFPDGCKVEGPCSITPRAPSRSPADGPSPVTVATPCLVGDKPAPLLRWRQGLNSAADVRALQKQAERAARGLPGRWLPSAALCLNRWGMCCSPCSPPTCWCACSQPPSRCCWIAGACFLVLAGERGALRRLSFEWAMPWGLAS